MSDFASLVAKLNAISSDEQPLESVSGTDLYAPVNVKETVEGIASTKRLLSIFNEIDAEKVVAEAKDAIEEEHTEENVVDSMKARFSDFMKAEVAQGNDITTVSDAVTEGTAAADAIGRAFNAMFKNMDQLMSITKDGGQLRKMVEEEGGDPEVVDEAHRSLIIAYQKLEEAHMYSQSPELEDE
jgi:thiamine biosynthesis lipoprotein ApbE